MQAEDTDMQLSCVEDKETINLHSTHLFSASSTLWRAGEQRWGVKLTRLQTPARSKRNLEDLARLLYVGNLQLRNAHGRGTERSTDDLIGLYELLDYFQIYDRLRTDLMSLIIYRVMRRRLMITDLTPLLYFLSCHPQSLRVVTPHIFFALWHYRSHKQARDLDGHNIDQVMQLWDRMELKGRICNLTAHNITHFRPFRVPFVKINCNVLTQKIDLPIPVGSRP